VSSYKLGLYRRQPSNHASDISSRLKGIFDGQVKPLIAGFAPAPAILLFVYDVSSRQNRNCIIVPVESPIALVPDNNKKICSAANCFTGRAVCPIGSKDSIHEFVISPSLFVPERDCQETLNPSDSINNWFRYACVPYSLLDQGPDRL
jgi:hypothetical protein